jgi:hypothetical protein
MWSQYQGGEESCKGGGVEVDEVSVLHYPMSFPEDVGGWKTD